MRNKRILFVLFGAAAFGLVAAVAVSRYLSNAQALTRDMRKVVVVKVDDVVGVAGFPRPGSLVDVVVVIQPTDNTTGGGGPISKIVLQNIKVLASGQNIDQPKNGDRDAQQVKAVTLQVTPEEAEKL